MATVTVSKATANARSGKPPGAGKINPGKLHSGPGFSSSKTGPKEVSHTEGRSSGSKGKTPYRKRASGTAIKAASAVNPELRAARAARILPSTDRENRTHKVRLPVPRADQRTSSAGNHAPVILAEYVLAMIIIVIKTITGTAKTSYQEAMAVAMLQASALTGVFFILFLISSGKRASKVAAWFGVLIDLGVLFTAVNDNAIADFTSLVQGKGLPGGITLLSNSTPQEFYSTASDWVETPASGTAPAAPASPAAPNAPNVPSGGRNQNPQVPANPGGTVTLV